MSSHVVIKFLIQFYLITLYIASLVAPSESHDVAVDRSSALGSELDPKLRDFDLSPPEIGDPIIKIRVEKEILEFDESALLQYEPDSVAFPPFKWMTFIVKSLLARPHFFPVSFSIFTRRDYLEDITFKKRVHKLEIYNDINDTQSNYHRIFEYDLHRLSSIRGLDLRRRTIVIIPGYLTNKNTPWMYKVKDRWLEYEDVNVITVDWSLGNHGIYNTAVANLRMVSRQITMLLYYLSQVHYSDFESTAFRSNLYLVGHSLGAHIAGWVGHEFRGEIARITGLDPAGPLLDNLPMENRLNPTNAMLVDVIHTNGGTMTASAGICNGLGIIKCSTVSNIAKWARLGPRTKGSLLAASLLVNFQRQDREIYYGMHKPIGHIDYYANGGQQQPGCSDELRICDHSRAPLLYSNAIGYEIGARTALGEDSSFIRDGRHRLIAFASPDYERFRSGQHIFRNCPDLIYSNKQETKERWKLVKNCAIPMDFVTPVEDLMKELWAQYGFEFDGELKYSQSNSRRYFFDTSATEPYVSEQYLLKVSFAPKFEIIKETQPDTSATDDEEEVDEPDEPLGSFRWGKGCKLKVFITPLHREDSYSSLNYGASLTTFESKNFYGLVLPFANPVDWNSYHPTEGMTWIKRVEALKSIQNNQIEVDLDPSVADEIKKVETSVSRLIKFVPGKVFLGISHQSHTFKEAYTSLTNILSSSKSNRCRLEFNRIEVQPVGGIDSFDKALYVEHTIGTVLEWTPKVSFMANQVREANNLGIEDSTSLDLKHNLATVSLDTIVIRNESEDLI